MQPINDMLAAKLNPNINLNDEKGLFWLYFYFYFYFFILLLVFISLFVSIALEIIK